MSHPTRTAPVHRGARGFTLIELMITIAVVAILATIAVPSYRVYVERANRTVAKTSMVDVVSRQNSYYVDRKRFATTLTKLGLGADTLYLDRAGTLSASDGADSIYEVKLAGNANSTACPATGSATTSGFTIVARPIHSQVSDTRCATMCLSSSGIKSSSGTDAGNCWTR